eukprot:CAMPEP_0172908130 /NCGR_PEP_ID=MMETSP1075-20121228/180156_1 /TAXON_ID=2916 /ORGANISM="Ceratium fusus, Strain PA161109" /LENGTH=332 /DNA_ID=CAMNT_0013765857 /DNA_START=119 /DNA_END=1118 /DNA_ORIENTATION=-
MALLCAASICLALCLPGGLCQANRRLYDYSRHRPRSYHRQGHGAEWEFCTDPPSLVFPVLCISIMGAWAGPVFIAWLKTSPSCPADHLDEMLVHLTEPKIAYFDPHTLHLLSRTRDRTMIHEPRKGYAIRATFHHGILFALDNHTLFSAQHNKIDEIPVFIVKKPSKFNKLLRHERRPFHSYFDVEIVYEENPDLARLQLSPGVHKQAKELECFRARSAAMRIPADAFPTSQEGQYTQQEGERELHGSVVLVADRIVKPREKLVDLIRSRRPDLGVQDPPGDVLRSYACVPVPLKHEAVTRRAIKALGKERGKSSINIKALPETLLFDSPHD